MLVLQPTSICFLKRFLTAMHSGKIYIRHLFRYGQLRQSHLALKDLLVVEIIGSTKYTLSIANTGIRRRSYPTATKHIEMCDRRKKPRLTQG